MIAFNDLEQICLTPESWWGGSSTHVVLWAAQRDVAHMEDAKMETKETISKTDWEKTPKTVKKLVKQLVGTLNVVVIPEWP